jgi:hypothetical protein
MIGAVGMGKINQVGSEDRAGNILKSSFLLVRDLKEESMHLFLGKYSMQRNKQCQKGQGLGMESRRAAGDEVRGAHHQLLKF